MARFHVSSFTLLAVGLLVALDVFAQQVTEAPAPVDRGYRDMPGPEVWRYPQPASRWLEQQRERATVALRGRQYDLLILPFQARGHSFDVSERSLLTLSLARTIDEKTDVRVADPVLVAQVLGAYERRFDHDAVTKLAEQLGVRKIAVFDIGHDGVNRYRMRMRIAAPGDSLELNDDAEVSVFEEQEFHEYRTPSSQFHELRDLIAQRIAGELQPTEERVYDTAIIDIPIDVAEFSDPANDVLAIHYLQFLGVMGSRKVIERSRDMLFERSLIMLESIDWSSAHYRLLTARALFYLNRRPLALALLEEPESPAERAFQAFLNGNLKQSQEDIEQIESPMLAAIARLESERLRYNYSGALDDSFARSAIESYGNWGVMLYTALLDSTPWQEFSTVPVKIAADQLFPVEQYSLETTFSGKAAGREEPSEYEIAEISLRHLEKVDREAEYRSETLLGPRDHDVIEMLRTQLVGQVHGGIDRWRSPQGLPKRAIAIADEFESLLSGHPSYLAVKGAALNAEARDARGARRKSLYDRGNRMFRETLQLSHGLYNDTFPYVMQPAWAFPRYLDYSQDVQELLLHARDWPWPARGLTVGPALAQGKSNLLCIHHSNWSIYCLRNLISLYGNAPDSRAWLGQVIASLGDRYLGSSIRSEVFAGFHLRNDDVDAAEKIISAAIAAGSLEWYPYHVKGRRLVREGKSEDARALFESFPGFTNKEGKNAVALSANAANAAWALMRAGSIEMALPFFEMSANFPSGSGHAMQSAMYIHLINGNYEAAVEQASARIRRYDSGTSDLIGLALISGLDELAEAAGAGALQKLDSAQIWGGLLTLHRAQNADAEEKMQWAANMQDDIPGDDGAWLALRYVLLSGTMDREISSDFPKRFAALDDRDPLRRLGDGTILRNGKTLNYPTFVTSRLPTGPDQPEKAVKELSNYAAQGLTSIDQGDYQRAYQLWDEVADYYPLHYYLPYYALAAALVDKTERAEDYLASLKAHEANEYAKDPEATGTFFYGYLTESVLAAGAGRHDSALESLRRSFSEPALMRNRGVYPQYQAMEIGRILLQEFDDERYRDLTLNYARRTSVSMPQASWVHSFVAMLSKDEIERIDALARVLVLDPQSRAVKRADKRELLKARKIAENGYLRPEGGRSGDTVAAL